MLSSPSGQCGRDNHILTQGQPALGRKGTEGGPAGRIREFREAGPAGRTLALWHVRQSKVKGCLFIHVRVSRVYVVAPAILNATLLNEVNTIVLSKVNRDAHYCRTRNAARHLAGQPA